MKICLSLSLNCLPLCEHPLFIHIRDVNVIFWLLHEINLMSLFFVPFTSSANNKLRVHWNKSMSVDFEITSVGVGDS